MEKQIELNNKIKKLLEEREQVKVQLLTEHDRISKNSNIKSELTDLRQELYKLTHFKEKSKSINLVRKYTILVG